MSFFLINFISALLYYCEKFHDHCSALRRYKCGIYTTKFSGSTRLYLFFKFSFMFLLRLCSLLTVILNCFE